jgi:hypothetical protein
VTNDPEGAAALAAPGRDYVLSNYGWDPVLDAVEENLAQWTGATKERRDSDCEVVG